MNNKHYLEDQNLSLAWARALRLVGGRGRSEIVPLVVSVTGFDKLGQVAEDNSIRSSIDALLLREGKQTIDTVANTIFPVALWNPKQPRAFLFDRYARILPRLRKASRKNGRGIYFERFITGGPVGHENQLDFAISTYQTRKGVRRSVLQAAVFNPGRDHSAAALLGFPCLQHVSFAPTDAGLAVNAFYAAQYLVERAYGNYLGLCRLGQFVAHELGLPLVRMTCFTGIAECDMTKAKISDVLSEISRVLGPDEEEGIK